MINHDREDKDDRDDELFDGEKVQTEQTRTFRMSDKVQVICSQNEGWEITNPLYRFALFILRIITVRASLIHLSIPANFVPKHPTQNAKGSFERGC
jgi:hypothetical protein